MLRGYFLRVYGADLLLRFVDAAVVLERLRANWPDARAAEEQVRSTPLLWR